MKDPPFAPGEKEGTQEGCEDCPLPPFFYFPFFPFIYFHFRWGKEETAKWKRCVCERLLLDFFVSSSSTLKDGKRKSGMEIKYVGLLGWGERCAKCFHLASFGNRIIFGHSAASDSIGSVAIPFLFVKYSKGRDKRCRDFRRIPLSCREGERI